MVKRDKTNNSLEGDSSETTSPVVKDRDDSPDS